MLQTAIGRLRAIGLAEGVSFLCLLGVAMPLKYVVGMPMAVKVVGWIHGVLFLLYMLALRLAAAETRWSFGRVLALFAAAVVPFGTFFADGWLRRQDQAPAPATAAST